MEAPAFRASLATASLQVSMLMGTEISLDRPSITGMTRSISSSMDTRSENGRLDSPPTSIKSAPSSAIVMPCTTAFSLSRNRPPSEKESVVTLSTPMTWVFFSRSRWYGPHSSKTAIVSSSQTAPGDSGCCGSSCFWTAMISSTSLAVRVSFSRRALAILWSVSRFSLIRLLVFSYAVLTI